MEFRLWAEFVELEAVLTIGVVLEDAPTKVDVTFEGDESDEASSCDGGNAVNVALLTAEGIEAEEEGEVEEPVKKKKNVVCCKSYCHVCEHLNFAESRPVWNIYENS